jgi:hypothetical protein
MKHSFRGALSAWMALIVLQTIGTRGGSGKIASLFSDVNGLVTRALSPDVAAIPDRRGGLSAGDTPSPYLNGITPNQLRRGAANAGIVATPGFQQGVKNGTGNLTQDDVTRLEGQLGGLTGYTPDQLMHAYGIPNH